MGTFELDQNYDSGVQIKVVGVGGGGNNAVNRMMETNIRGVEFIAVNTDKQVLVNSNASHKIAIGDKITKGHGAGADPDKGRHAAEESADEIASALRGSDMVFITAGMGGGTGTGAAPVIAKLAKDLDILTIGIVTKPFAFEGRQRMLVAEQGIANLREFVDSLIIIPNERLKLVSDTKITMQNGFMIADDVLRQGVQSISELINVPGYINLDFADVTAVMKDAGYAHMGMGSATGKDKAELATKIAISSPLLETSIAGARGMIVSITASPDIGLDEVDFATAMVTNEAHPECNIIVGIAFDNTIEDSMKVTVIATGFDSSAKEQSAVKPATNPYSTGFGFHPQTSVKTSTPTVRPAQPKAQPEAPKEVPVAKEPEKPQPAKKAEDGVISDSDLDDIMSILSKTRRGNNPYGN